MRPLPAALFLPARARVCVFPPASKGRLKTAGDETGVLPGTFNGLIGAMGRLRLLAVVVVEAKKRVFPRSLFNHRTGRWRRGYYCGCFLFLPFGVYKEAGKDGSADGTGVRVEWAVFSWETGLLAR